MAFKKSLQQTHPHLMEIWDFEKNKNIANPNNITFGQHIKVYWLCPNDKNHSYLLSVNSKTNNKNGCPQCSGRQVSTTNSLIKKYPNIIKEWDYEKNTILPSEISFSSHKKVWFKCLINGTHESFLKSPNIRLKQTNSCPTCKKEIDLNHKQLIDLYDVKHNDDGQRFVISVKIRSKKNIAKINGNDWKLSNLEVAEMITSPCFYCKRKFPTLIGIDRVDNNLGYFISNCVPCCKFCNTAKLDSNITEFKKWITKSYYMIFVNQIQLLNNNEFTNKIYYKFKSNAKVRNINFNISKEEMKNILKYNCGYCNSSNNIGIDRIDNEIGYEKSNCIACCKICNRAKLTQSLNEFKNMIDNLYQNINNF